MYSLVMMAAMTAAPDVPQDFMCPVTPSKYGCTFWSNHCFYDCCAPARYGWVNCWNKGFGFYPGNAAKLLWRMLLRLPLTDTSSIRARGACQCGPCAGYGGGHGGGCTWCGCGWSIGDQPAYYTSALGCPPYMSAPPYACCADKNPCCHTMSLAFDTGLAGLSQGVGYAGMGGYGNFGFYGAVPMIHRPTTLDLPPFPRRDYSPSPIPLAPAPMPPLPSGKIPEAKPGELPAVPSIPAPDDAKKPSPKKVESRNALPQIQRSAPATVVLSVPAGAVVTVDGETLASTGLERSFRSPSLQPGKEFVYTVRAVMIVGNRQEEETLQVKVTAGEISRASFEKLFACVESTGKKLADAKTAR